MSAVLTPGAVVLVEFIEGNRSLPLITHFSTPDDPAFLPVSVALDASGTVAIGPSASTVALAGGSVVVAPGAEDGRPVRWSDPVKIPIVGGFAIGAIQLAAPSQPVSKVTA